MLRNEIYVLAIQGNISEAISSFDGAYQMVNEICKGTSHSPTHVGYSGLTYNSTTLKTLKRIEKKLGDISKHESFVSISFAELPKEFQTAIFDYIFYLIISRKNNQLSFSVQNDRTFMKHTIPIILEIHKGSEVQLFRTTDAGNYLDIFDEDVDVDDIEGYGALDIERFLTEE